LNNLNYTKPGIRFLIPGFFYTKVTSKFEKIIFPFSASSAAQSLLCADEIQHLDNKTPTYWLNTKLHQRRVKTEPQRTQRKLLFKFSLLNFVRLLFPVLCCLFTQKGILSAEVTTTASGIYLKAQENGLPIGIANGKVLNPEFEYAWGFRVGFGYALPHDFWDIELRYTHIHNNAWSENKGVIYPSWSVGVFDKEKTHWRLHLGVIDLELLRYSFNTSCFHLRPHFGARTAWIRQKFNVNYGDEECFTSKNKFWGMGLMGGLNGEWYLFREFSLNFDTAYSLLAGQFYLHEHNDYRVRNTFNQTASIVDLALGPKWELGNFSLAWAWENHFYFNQNQLVHFTSKDSFFSNQGDIFLQGWSFKFCYAF